MGQLEMRETRLRGIFIISINRKLRFLFTGFWLHPLIVDAQNILKGALTKSIDCASVGLLLDFFTA